MSVEAILLIVLGIIVAVLYIVVVVLIQRINNLKYLFLATDSRIDAVRLNFLLGLRNNMIQQERYEEVEFIDELIFEEFGEMDFSKITNDIFIDLL